VPDQNRFSETETFFRFGSLRDAILAHLTMAEGLNAVFSQLPSSPAPDTLQAPWNTTSSTARPLTITKSLRIHLV
jgi:hypothetical protein